MTFIFLDMTTQHADRKVPSRLEEKQTGAAVFNLSGQLATLCHLKLNIDLCITKTYTYIYYNQMHFPSQNLSCIGCQVRIRPGSCFFFPLFPCFFPTLFPNGKWLRKNWCEMDFKTFRRFCGEHGESYITIIKDWRAGDNNGPSRRIQRWKPMIRKKNHDKSTVCCSILHLKVV